jgi:hypothetical protein
MFKILGTYICWKKYIKCNIWRVAVRPSYIWDARFLKVNTDDCLCKEIYSHTLTIPEGSRSFTLPDF